MVNEISAGSSCKYRLDKATGQLSLARILPDGIRYPANYGFVPGTRSKADGEEVDILVLAPEPLVPLSTVRARIVGGFAEQSSDEDMPDDRLIAVVVDDPSSARILGLADVDTAFRDDLATFVRTHKQNEGIQSEVCEWFDRDEAITRVARGFKRGRRRPAK